MSRSNILVTGAAGFIGYHVCRVLLERGKTVIGLDDLNPYYDVTLKEARLDRLRTFPEFSFTQVSVEDAAGMSSVFAEGHITHVIHLAAQAGVRYSILHPEKYVQSNLVGFANVLQECRLHQVAHLVYASSSSVYGLNTTQPFSVHDNVDHPISLYAASKKANELMAHSYAHLYALPTTGLRFFTVYGPWGRPDMAIFKFTKAILAGEPIDLYNHGNMLRDFTYVDDIAEGVVRTLDCVATPNPAWNGAAPDPATSSAPYRVYNIGNHTPVRLDYFVECLEKAIGKRAIRNNLPMQAGDVPSTCADVKDLCDAVGFTPATPIEQGIAKFVAWYREYYAIP